MRTPPPRAPITTPGTITMPKTKAFSYIHFDNVLVVG